MGQVEQEEVDNQIDLMYDRIIAVVDVKGLHTPF